MRGILMVVGLGTAMMTILSAYQQGSAVGMIFGVALILTFALLYFATASWWEPKD
jgi:hypothetical protein